MSLFNEAFKRKKQNEQTAGRSDSVPVSSPNSSTSGNLTTPVTDRQNAEKETTQSKLPEKKPILETDKSLNGRQAQEKLREQQVLSSNKRDLGTRAKSVFSYMKEKKYSKARIWSVMKKPTAQLLVDGMNNKMYGEVAQGLLVQLNLKADQKNELVDELNTKKNSLNSKYIESLTKSIGGVIGKPAPVPGDKLIEAQKGPFSAKPKSDSKPNPIFAKAKAVTSTSPEKKKAQGPNQSVG